MSINKVKELTKNYEEKVKELQNEIGSQFDGVLNEFFQKYPEVLSIRWEQYTPYYNDGDPCVFRVHEPRLNFKDSKNGDGERGDGFFYSWDFYKNPDDKRKKICEEAEDFIKEFPEEVMESLFEDHVQITVNRNGERNITEYDHD